MTNLEVSAETFILINNSNLIFNFKKNTEEEFAATDSKDVQKIETQV